MRMMLRFTFQAETGNELLRSGRINQMLQDIATDLKPEAAYFFPESGQRSGFFIFNLDDSSQMVQVVEPFWFGLGADVEVIPVMSQEDLMKGMAGLQGVI